MPAKPVPGLAACGIGDRGPVELEKALKLGALAEKLFPDYTPLMLEVQTTREYAALEGLTTP